MKTGILILNLGTPDHPNKKSVRAYLRQFLSDAKVIDLPLIGRWLLVNLVIVPFRAKKSAVAFQKIWTKDGSPLKIYSAAIKTKLQNKLGNEYFCLLGMRYQNPSIPAAFDQFQQRGIDQIMVVPLFPQYATASYGSAIAKVYAEAAKRWNTPSLCVVPPFFDKSFYIDALEQLLKDKLSETTYDKYIFSFHGLPISHCEKSIAGQENPPDSRSTTYDYPAQCLQLSTTLAKRLEIPSSQWATSYQSRLGKAEWLAPSTLDLTIDYAKAGHKKLLIIPLSFITDCLETLEELSISLASEFKKAGGTQLDVLACLNDQDTWCDGLAQHLKQHSTL